MPIFEKNREYFCYNAIGSVVALIDSDTNISNTDYEAFGKEVRTTGGTSETRKFCTKERDASIGLDNFGFRYYDADLGRFITRDPSGYPDGPNNYLYCHNNPINHIDPLGLREQDEEKSLLGATTGTVVGHAVGRGKGLLEIAATPPIASVSSFVKDRVSTVIDSNGSLADRVGAAKDLAAPGYALTFGAVSEASKDLSSFVSNAYTTGDTPKNFKEGVPFGMEGSQKLLNLESAVGNSLLMVLGFGEMASQSANGKGLFEGGTKGSGKPQMQVEEVKTQQKSISKNANAYEGDVYVYSIENSEGFTKVGESATGLNKAGKSIRAETQARTAIRNKGSFHETKLRHGRKPFKSKAEARAYESKLRDRYRRMKGGSEENYDVLPDNKEHLKGRRK